MAKRTRKTEKIPGVVAYCRVSTEEQAISGLGLAAQEKAIKAECKRRGLPLAAVHTDAGLSGKTLVRPALTAALAALNSGAGSGRLAAASTG